MTKTSYEIHVIRTNNEQFLHGEYNFLEEAIEAKKLLEINNRKYNLYQFVIYKVIVTREKVE